MISVSETDLFNEDFQEKLDKLEKEDDMESRESGYDDG